MRAKGSRCLQYLLLWSLFRTPMLASELEVLRPEACEAQFAFLPGTLLFTPPAASYAEPRVGLRKEISTSRLKVDIGSTMDIVEFRILDGRSSRLRAGIDFFTYALSTNAQGLRLQIDAVDGYFGGHISFASDFDATQVSARLRLMHLSAHFLDGHFDNSRGEWKDGRAPVPFTRDFGELAGAVEFKVQPLSCRIYAGFAFATLIRPTDISRFQTLQGIEVYSDQMTGKAFGRPLNLFVGYHISLVGVNDRVAGTSNVEFGLKFGTWKSTGIKLYASYYSGLEVFSQYYDMRTENWGLGFAFDFW